MLTVGKGLTVTLPVTLSEVHPVVGFLTFKVKGIELPEAGVLKLTVMELPVKVALMTPVMPVPEIEYKVGEPVVAV